MTISRGKPAESAVTGETVATSLPEEEIVRVERGELGAQKVDLVAAAKVDDDARA